MPVHYIDTTDALRTRRHCPALLLMGGIGDMLHYIVRMPDLLFSLGSDALDVFVESLVPRHAEELFQYLVPDLSVFVLPPRLHWVNTFPLLRPLSSSDRLNRPAYRLVESLGYRKVIDWFLPFACGSARIDVRALDAICQARPEISSNYAVISVRDKGFLWWPNEQTFEDLQHLLSAGTRVVYVGDAVEQQPYMPKLFTCPRILDALALSYHAHAYIGTDTGLATVRELAGKANIYCINKFWLERVMTRYGYVDKSSTLSTFAFDAEDLRAAIAAR